MKEPERDWSAFLAAKPWPGIDPADVFDNPSMASWEPFRRDDWERLAEGYEEQLMDGHSDSSRPHDGGYLHPFCRHCEVLKEDYDNWRRGRPTSDDLIELSIDNVHDRTYDKYVNPIESLVMARLRWYMVRHGGKIPEDLDPQDNQSAEYLDRAELDALVIPPQLISGILPRAALGILRGRDQSFKSFLGLDWALCIATGKPWQGHDVERARVLYVAGEGVFGLQKRIAAWEYAWHAQVEEGWLTVRRSGLNLAKPGAAYRHLVRFVEDRQFGLTVIDTLRRVSGSTDGNSSEMGAVIDNLDRLKVASGGTVLTLAHTGKDDNDTRGWSGLEDDMDFVFHAKRDGSVLSLECSKMKDGPEAAALQLRADRVLDSLVLAQHTEGLTLDELGEAERAVLAAMRTTFAQTGCTTNELIEVTGLTKTSAYRARGSLLEAGLIRQVGKSPRIRLELVETD